MSPRSSAPTRSRVLPARMVIELLGCRVRWTAMSFGAVKSAMVRVQPNLSDTVLALVGSAARLPTSVINLSSSFSMARSL